MRLDIVGTRGKATMHMVNEDSSANIPSTEDANTTVIQIHVPLVLRDQTSQKHSVFHEKIVHQYASRESSCGLAS